MRRALSIALALAATLSLGACSSQDNTFTVENGVCYRTQTNHVLGVRTSKAKVLAVPENCGLPSQEPTTPTGGSGL